MYLHYTPHAAHPSNGKAHRDSRDFIEDGIEWRRCKSMPSFRCGLISRGELLLLPAGTFHYIYTARTKAVLAVRPCGSGAVEQWSSATVRQCCSAAVWQCSSVAVQ